MGHGKHAVRKNVGLLHAGSALNGRGSIWRVRGSSFGLNAPLVR